MFSWRTQANLELTHPAKRIDFPKIKGGLVILSLVVFPLSRGGVLSCEGIQRMRILTATGYSRQSARNGVRLGHDDRV